MKKSFFLFIVSLLSIVPISPVCVTNCISCGSGVCDTCGTGFYLLIETGIEECLANCPTTYYNGQSGGKDTCLQQTEIQVTTKGDEYKNVVYVSSTDAVSSVLYNYLSQTLSVYFAHSGEVIPFSLKIKDGMTVSVTLEFTSGVDYNELITFNYASNNLYSYMMTRSTNITSVGYFHLTESAVDILKYYNYAIHYAMIALQFKAVMFIILGGGKLVSPIQTFFYLNLIEVFKFMNIPISNPIDDFFKAIDSDMFALVQEYIQEYLLESDYFSVTNYEPARFAYFERKVYLSDYFGLGIVISVIVFLVWGSVRLMRTSNIIQTDSNKYYLSLEWNVLLSFFYAFALKFILASTLQLYHYNFDTLYGIINTSGAIFLLVMYIVTFFILVLRTLKIKRIMELSGTILGRENIFFAKKFRLLFYDMNIKDAEAVWYLQVHFSRYFYLVPLLIWVQGIELIQFFGFVAGSLIVIIFLIKFMPFKDRLNRWTGIYNEAAIMMMIIFYAVFYNFKKNSNSINDYTYTGFAFMGITSSIILCESIKGIIEIISAFLKLADDKKITTPRTPKVHPVKTNAKENAKDAKI